MPWVAQISDGGPRLLAGVRGTETWAAQILSSPSSLRAEAVRGRLVSADVWGPLPLTMEPWAARVPVLSVLPLGGRCLLWVSLGAAGGTVGGPDTLMRGVGTSSPPA